VLDWVPRWLRWVFGATVMALVLWFLVVPQFGQAESALDAVTRVHLGFVVAGGALVALAVYAQAELTRVVLPEDERPGRAEMVQLELASTAVSHTVPGGTAAGTALAYRLLTQTGAQGSSVGFALGIRGIGSALVLNVILWAALLVSIPTQGFDSRYTTAAVLGTVLLTVAGVVHVAGREELRPALRAAVASVLALQLALAVVALRGSAAAVMVLLLCVATTVLAALAGGLGDARAVLAAGSGAVLVLLARSLRWFPEHRP